MIASFLAGFAGGLAGTFGAHHTALKNDELYRDTFESDEQAQSLLPGAFVAMSAANSLLTSFLCWFFALPAAPVGACTGVALFLLVWVTR
jgi:hypothetical protein